MRENFTNCFYQKPSTAQTVVKFFFYTAIFAVSSFGNMVLCFVVWRRQRLQTVMNYFLVNLATADLAFTIICIPFDLYVQERGFIWPFGEGMCKLLYPLQTMTLYASVLTLCAISFSRYRAIVRPMKKQLTIRVSKCLIFCIWMAAFIMVVPYIAILQVDAECQYCIEKWPEPALFYRRIYTLVIFFSQYFIPLSVIFCAYLRVWCALRSKREPCSPNHTRENAKVLKMVVVLTLFFAVCLLPNHIVYLALDFTRDGSYIIHTDWIIASNFMIFLNTALDPVLYTMFNEKYRLEFKGILSVCKRADHSPKPDMFAKLIVKNEQSLINPRVIILKSTTEKSPFTSLEYIEQKHLENNRASILR